MYDSHEKATTGADLAETTGEGGARGLRALYRLLSSARDEALSFSLQCVVSGNWVELRWVWVTPLAVSRETGGVWRHLRSARRSAESLSIKRRLETLQRSSLSIERSREALQRSDPNLQRKAHSSSAQHRTISCRKVAVAKIQH